MDETKDIMHVKLKKSATEGQILHNSAYMKYLK